MKAGSLVVDAIDAFPEPSLDPTFRLWFAAFVQTEKVVANV